MPVTPDIPNEGAQELIKRQERFDDSLLDDSSSSYPLEGTVLHYEDPFGPAAPLEDWDVLKF